MPRTSKSPTAIRALNSTESGSENTELPRFDAAEVRSLTLVEIDFVTGGSSADIPIIKYIDKGSTKIF
jgi:hypothetical protein